MENESESSVERRERVIRMRLSSVMDRFGDQQAQEARKAIRNLDRNNRLCMEILGGRLARDDDVPEYLIEPVLIHLARVHLDLLETACTVLSKVADEPKAGAPSPQEPDMSERDLQVRERLQGILGQFPAMAADKITQMIAVFDCIVADFVAVARSHYPSSSNEGQWIIEGVIRAVVKAQMDILDELCDHFDQQTEPLRNRTEK